MSARPTLIFDFDSTLVDFETLEALADIALADAPGASDTRAQIAALTDQAMGGEIEARNREAGGALFRLTL